MAAVAAQILGTGAVDAGGGDRATVRAGPTAEAGLRDAGAGLSTSDGFHQDTCVPALRLPNAAGPKLAPLRRALTIIPALR